MFNLYRLDPKGLNDPEGNKSVPKDLIWVGYNHKHPDGKVEPILSPWMDIVLAGSTETLQAYVDKLIDDNKYKSAPLFHAVKNGKGSSWQTWQTGQIGQIEQSYILIDSINLLYNTITTFGGLGPASNGDRKPIFSC